LKRSKLEIFVGGDQQKTKILLLFERKIAKQKKMCHNWKNGSHLEKWVTFGNINYNWKKGSYIEKKKVTLRKMGHTCKNWSHLEKKSRLEKCVTLGRKGHTCKKWVTLGKMGHPWDFEQVSAQFTNFFFSVSN